LLALLAFFLPISTALANTFYVLAVLLGILNFKNVLHVIDIPLPVLGFVIFFLLMIANSLIHGVSLDNYTIGVLKYLEIFCMPALAILFSKNLKFRSIFVKFFSVAMGLTMLLSYIRFVDGNIFYDQLSANFLVPRWGAPNNPTVFKWQITQNFLMSLATFLWAYDSCKLYSTNKRLSFFFAVLCVLGFINVIFLVQGRVGYLVIFTGLAYILTNFYGLKRIWLTILILVTLVSFTFLLSINFQERVTLVISDILSWSPGSPSHSSVGVRLEFIWQSLNIISHNIFFGVGVGNFSNEYLNQVQTLGMVESKNPHNQYVLFLVEMGLIGLLYFIFLNYICWKFSHRLNNFWGHATRIVLLAYLVGNLTNSFLYDSCEGLFFTVFLAISFSELLREKKEEVIQT
jgi:O-antigen ligase